MNKVSKDNFTQEKYKYGFVTEIESEKIPKGLNEDVIKLISKKKNEPEWMLEWRLSAFKRLENMSVPKWAKAEKRYKEETAGLGTPTDTLDDAMKAYFDYKKKSDSTSRKGRVLDNALEFLNMRMQTPFIMDTLKDASTFKQQQLLDAERVKQGLPNAQQLRMQAASNAFATEAAAIAAQQEAANRFAGLGMQRRFG